MDLGGPARCRRTRTRSGPRPRPQEPEDQRRLSRRELFDGQGHRWLRLRRRGLGRWCGSLHHWRRTPIRSTGGGPVVKDGCAGGHGTHVADIIAGALGVALVPRPRRQGARPSPRRAVASRCSRAWTSRWTPTATASRRTRAGHHQPVARQHLRAGDRRRPRPRSRLPAPRASLPLRRPATAATSPTALTRPVPLRRQCPSPRPRSRRRPASR